MHEFIFPIAILNGACFFFARRNSPCVSMNDLADPIFDGVGQADFKSRDIFFIGLNCSLHFCLLLFCPFFSFFLDVGIVGLGTDRVSITLSRSYIVNLF